MPPRSFPHHRARVLALSSQKCETSAARPPGGSGSHFDTWGWGWGRLQATAPPAAPPAAAPDMRHLLAAAQHAVGMRRNDDPDMEPDELEL